MREIQIFNHPRFGEVRVSQLESGEPLFVATDVCKVLGYTNTSKAIGDHTEDDERYNESLDRGGSILMINESGLYSLILRSNKIEAKSFRKWVTSEVLPAIRKTGGYIVTNEEDTPETILARAVLVAQDSINRLKNQIEIKQQQLLLANTTIKTQAPKVEYYDEVLDSEGLISTTIIAKDLGMSASALNRKLHMMGIIFPQNGTWVPYSKYQGNGLSKSKTFPYQDKDGKQKTAIHFYWTEKGREFIMSKITKLLNA
jgi:prophage antirepressor-like protein